MTTFRTVLFPCRINALLIQVSRVVIGVRPRAHMVGAAASLIHRFDSTASIDKYNLYT